MSHEPCWRRGQKSTGKIRRIAELGLKPSMVLPRKTCWGGQSLIKPLISDVHPGQLVGTNMNEHVQDL